MIITKLTKLTNREYEILAYIAVGMSVKEIADYTCRSIFTIRKTLENVKLKLGFQKATELTAYFLCQHFRNEFLSAELVMINI